MADIDIATIAIVIACLISTILGYIKFSKCCGAEIQTRTPPPTQTQFSRLSRIFRAPLYHQNVASGQPTRPTAETPV